MTLLHYTKINMLNKKEKMLSFYIIVTLLGILLSVSILVKQAISSAEDRLWQQAPHLVSFDINWEGIDFESQTFEFEEISSAMINQIGSLPQVRSFSYTLPVQVIGENFSHYYPENSGLEEMITNFLNQYYDYHWLYAHGVGGNFIPEFELGLLQLTEGRMLQDGDEQAIVLSNRFAENNGLLVGDYIQLTTATPRESMYGSPFTSTSPKEIFKVEIVGIFELTHDFESGISLFDYQRQHQLLNLFYIPFGFSEILLNQKINYLSAIPDFLGGGHDFSILWDRSNAQQASFLLYDIRELEEFRNASQNHHPTNWRIRDYSEIMFPQMLEAISTLDGMMNSMLWGAVFTTIIATILFIFIYLRDSKIENGIFLALGETKRKIYLRLNLEILLISFLSIITSIIISSFLASHISASFLNHDLIYGSSNPFKEFDVLSQICIGCQGYSFRFNNPGFLSIDEMLDSYRVSLSLDILLTITISFIGLIFISTAMASSYLWRMSPKDILTKST